jgi:hypothetical protein
MIADDLGEKLHLRARLGEQLSPQELALLEAWYAYHDAEKNAALAVAMLPQDAAAIQARLTDTANRLVSLLSQRLDAMIVENQRLSDELSARRTADSGEDDFDIREAYPLMDEVARREGWDDPEMDSYDIYARQPKP